HAHQIRGPRISRIFTERQSVRICEIRGPFSADELMIGPGGSVMNRILSLLFVSAVALWPGNAGAQKPAPIDVEVNQLVRLERDMWEAWHNRGLEGLRALTSPDYVTVHEFGRSTWPEVEAGFNDVTIDSFTLGEMSPLRVSRDVIMVTYAAEIHGTYK